MMTMAKAMSKAIERVDQITEAEIERVFPMEASGIKSIGYDYVLVGIDTQMADGTDMIYEQYEVRVKETDAGIETNIINTTKEVF